jgi:hypothetical protein
VLWEFIRVCKFVKNNTYVKCKIRIFCFLLFSELPGQRVRLCNDGIYTHTHSTRAENDEIISYLCCQINYMHVPESRNAKLSS